MPKLRLAVTIVVPVMVLENTVVSLAKCAVREEAARLGCALAQDLHQQLIHQVALVIRAVLGHVAIIPAPGYGVHVIITTVPNVDNLVVIGIVLTGVGNVCLVCNQKHVQLAARI